MEYDNDWLNIYNGSASGDCDEMSLSCDNETDFGNSLQSSKQAMLPVAFIVMLRIYLLDQ